MAVLSSVLQSIGKGISSFLGDSDHGFSSMSKKSERDELFSSKPFSQYLPYRAYDPETGIFISKSSLGFTIEAAPLVGSDFTFQKEMLSVFQELMEEGSSIQCMLLADHRVGPFLNNWEIARRDAPEIFQKMVKKRCDFYKTSKTVCSRRYRFLLSYSLPSKGANKMQLKSLKEIKERLLKILNTVTYAFPWDAKMFVHSLDGFINFQQSTDSRERNWDEMENLSSQLSRGGRLQVREDALQWKNEDNSLFRSYRTVDFPNSWCLSAMQNFIGDFFRESYRINTPFYLHYGVHCPSQERAENSNWMRMQAIENQGKSGALLRMIPALAEELRECDHVRRSIEQMDRFVWTQFGVGIWSEKEHIHRQEQAIKGLFRINGFSIAANDCLHLPQFISSLPMAWAEYVEDLKEVSLLKTTISSEASNLVPLQAEWYGTSTPGMCLLGRRGQIYHWYPFDNKNGNYNCVVVGRSGSGKSVFMQELLMSSLGVGARVFVLDVGKSFEKMCHMIGGQYIEFSKNVDLCLNPFTHISTTDAEEREQSFSLVKSIISSMAAPEHGATDFQNSLIEQAIRFAWKEHEQETNISHVVDYLCKHEDDRARSLGVILTTFTKDGSYGRYFEGKNNVNFENPMVLIELEELKEKKDLQIVVLQLFIMTITNQTFLGDRKTPFHICIDEAWDLLRGKQTGVFIETLARRLRKYNGSLVIGTQSVDDFYSTPGSLAAYENSDWMCLLSQKKSSIKRFSESGKVEMDEKKQAALESVHTKHGEYSEVMICDGEGNYSIGRLILDPFSGLLYSTKADEYAKVKNYQAKGMGVSQAIEKILEEGEKETKDDLVLQERS